MFAIKVESFEKLLPELKPILSDHYTELAMDKDKIPLAPMYDLYIAREKAGELITVTVRQDGKLVGYFLGFISPGIHYKTCLTCTMDILFIIKPLRKGSLGIRLMKFVERELKARKVNKWFVGSKLKQDISPLFKRLGFEPIEVYHSKWLGD